MEKVKHNTMLSSEEFRAKVSHFIVTENGHCPVRPLIEMLQGKWKLQIIYALCIKDPLRFGEIGNALSGVTHTALTNALKELERDGLIHREQFNEIPPRVEYSLTEKGSDLLPVFHAMVNWGLRYVS
ncbi:winged helix-turn-helix transcriptional regulator [Selenomonas ruminantium]|uniref:Transcriptional regulator, HxlR family n=1 Tax=Selenomonas ruminantium TaxID=971 RepID=A0A1I0V2M6_SELRU|nr:helix-turn-helix domain-containing protein [Selenomonas ruminantium]SFA70584.1 transcriptional regulator, HxlR family [Selenomonas ruminantium]